MTLLSRGSQRLLSFYADRNLSFTRFNLHRQASVFGLRSSVNRNRARSHQCVTESNRHALLPADRCTELDLLIYIRSQLMNKTCES